MAYTSGGDSSCDGTNDGTCNFVAKFIPTVEMFRRLSHGIYNMTATYSGDDNFYPGSGSIDWDVGILCV
jgi:hypothetical protein